VSEPYDYRSSPPSRPGGPQGWTGTSQLPAPQLPAPAPYYGQTGSGGGGFRPDRAKLLDYTLKGLGLLGVALVSGFLWFLIRNNPAAPPQAHRPSPTGPTGVYAFQPYQTAQTATDCVGHSTDHVRDYLAGHPCVSLRRSLFTASLKNGQEVVTSVAVVRMASADDAAGLKAVSDRDGSGHVRDLVEEGKVIPGGPKSLQNAGYRSALRGSRLVIVMTEYVDGDLDDRANLKAKDALLKTVSGDAIKQSVGVTH
jgi:hypothetical protein